MSHVLTAGRLSPVRAMPLGEGSWKLAPGFRWTLPYVPLTFVDFNLHLFTVIPQHEHNSFSEFCESF